MHRTFLILTIIASAAFAVTGPSAETLKEVLSRRLQSLRPTAMTERNVLFQEVRAGTPSGGTYPFQVTLLVRDYGPGYPANRFYGETCVSRFDKARFALSPYEFGGWQVEGAMTPSMEATKCTKNPAAGVSSIPLASLPGSSAPVGNLSASPQTPAATSPPPGTAGGAVASGNYECWANGRPRLLQNFSIRSNTQYTGSDGVAGNYSLDPTTGRLAFRGGALDGVLPKGFYTMYHAPKGMPTVSFRNSEGYEVSYCEKVR